MNRTAAFSDVGITNYGDHGTGVMVILQQNSEPIPGYFLSEKLGEGSFGVVWSAEGPGQTQVALKFLDLSQAGGVKEFEAISAIKNIRHPNLLPTIGYWLLGDRGQVVNEGGASRFRIGASQPMTLVIAMVVGEKSLVDVLDEFQSSGHAGIPVEQLLEYMKDIARGLDFLNSPRHDLGDGRLSSIQHRDIKPDNILIVGDAAVLCDFGVARVCHADSIRATGMIGSPAFISPESISGSGANRASDQYSLALTYYYLRTGAHAVLATDQSTAINCHVTGELNFSGVGDAEREVLRRATQMDASRRFASCREMVHSIGQSTVGANAFGTSKLQTGSSHADITVTRFDSRCQSTTAAGNPGDRSIVVNQHQGANASQGTALRNQSRPAGVKTESWRKPRRNHTSMLGSIASSTAMIALALVALMMVSGGPRVAANSEPVGKERAAGEPSVAARTVKQASERTVTETKMGFESSPVPDFKQPDVTASADLIQASQTPSEPIVVAETIGAPVRVSGAIDGSDDPVLQPKHQITAIESRSQETVGGASEVAAKADTELISQTEPFSLEQRAMVTYQTLGATFSIDGTELDLSKTAITNAGLSHLKDLPKLASLSLENTSIGDAGLREIVKHQPSLQSLYLSGTKVSDLGLAQLKKLSSLSRLDLSSCAVHDSGLMHLHELEGLTAIGLESTQVSEQGVIRLSEALRHGAVIQGPGFNLLGGQRF